MKRSKILLVLLLFTLSGCHFLKDEAPDLHGYVLKQTDSQIFVVSKIANDFSDRGGVKQFFDAITLDRVPKNVEVGQEVKVWYKGEVDVTYPACGSIQHLEIVEPKQPEGAKLSTEEVVKQALTKIDVEYFFAITDVVYNKDTSSWTVTYKPISLYNDDEEKLQSIQIPDL